MSRNRSIFSSRVTLGRNLKSSSPTESLPVATKEAPPLRKELSKDYCLMAAYLSARHPEARAILADILVREGIAYRSIPKLKEGPVSILVRYQMTPNKIIWLNKYQNILDMISQSILDLIDRWNLEEDIFENLKNGFQAYLSDLKWEFNIPDDALEHLMLSYEMGRKKIFDLEFKGDYSLEIEKDDVVRYETNVKRDGTLEGPGLKRKIEIIKIYSK